MMWCGCFGTCSDGVGCFWKVDRVSCVLSAEVWWYRLRRGGLC